MFRMATVVIGANVIPMPAPAMIAGTRKLIQVESGPAMYAISPIPVVNRAMPVMRMYLPPMRSERRPANGAVNMDVSDIGARVRPATSAEKPRTDWREMVMGRNALSMPKLIAAAIQLATVKLRSANSDSGASGSAWKRSQMTNRTISTTPAPMSSGIVIGYDSIWPQL